MSNENRGQSVVDQIVKRNSAIERAARGYSVVDQIEKRNSAIERAARGYSVVDQIEKRNSAIERAARGYSVVDQIEKRNSAIERAARGYSVVAQIEKRNSAIERAARGYSVVDQIVKRNSAIENYSVTFSKNLVVSKAMVAQVFPNKRVSKANVTSIFSGLSTSEYELKSTIEEKKLDAFLVKKSTNEKIPFKSLVSTVGVGDLLSNITKEEAISFYLHLTQFPMLGLQHKVGQRILNELENIKVTNVRNKILYRARPRDTNKRESMYSPEEMFSAPYGLSVQGRYNVQGQGELYTCDSKEIAIKECTKDDGTAVDVIKWELTQDVKLIDLTNKESPLIQYCSYSKQTSSSLEYLVPNFIAQCAKNKGITGIVFVSNQEENVLNYVFFDYLKGWFKPLNVEHVG